MKFIQNYKRNTVIHWLLNRMHYSVFLLILGMIACKPKATEQASKEYLQTDQFLDDQLPETFRAFYLKFHEDSLYQMQHIIFPLEGLPDHADPEDVKINEFYYTKDQWILHKQFDPKFNSIQFIIRSDILIEEQITEKKYGLKIIRRFANASDGWRLIYYAGLNKYSEN